MVPWPERGASGRPPRPAEPTSATSTRPSPPQNHFLTPQHAHAGTTGRYRSASRVSEVDAWDNMQNHQIQVDSSSSDEDLHPRSHPRPRPRHMRSMSHPFPSLFSSKKKRSSQMLGPDGSALDSGSEGPHHRHASPAAGSRDFTTGRCMTCGSLVRWPKELHVFKCTICVTINDLKPLDHGLRREGDAQEALSDPNDKAISLSHTRSVIEQCLQSFLISALNGSAIKNDTIEHKHTNPFHSHLAPRPPAPSSAATPTTLRPKLVTTSEPWLHPLGHARPSLHRRSPSWAGTTTRSSHVSSPAAHQLPTPLGRQINDPPTTPEGEAKRIFKPLEDYIVECFTSFHRLNSSFLVPRSHPHHHANPIADSKPRPVAPEPPELRLESPNTTYTVPELDPKLLLLGDVAENGTWWMGQEEMAPNRTASNRSQNGPSTVSSRSPHIDWAELEEWYTAAIDAARPWPEVYARLLAEDPSFAASPAALQEIEVQLLIGQEHTQRALLKACETILKRPGRRIAEPQELRFLLIIAANPLLHAAYKPYAGKFPADSRKIPWTPNPPSARGSGPSSGRHSVIIKRIVGLLANAPAECHRYLVAWLARYPELRFVQTKDLVSGFLAYRLLRQHEKKFEIPVDVTAGLIPSMQAGRSPASLHAALGHTPRSSPRKKKLEDKKRVVYQEDWQIKAAAQVLGFLFTANNMGHARRSLASRPDSPGNNTTTATSSGRHRDLVHAPGQVLATSDFYMTLLDEADLVAEFEAWERKQGRFSFCQHPFLLSIGAKIQILEHDARRQMENKARDAFFDSIMTNRIVQQFLVLDIRRECLVDDSLKAVSEVIGGGGEDIKKALKISFKGEEGVDAGGLRKEWFLLLVREVFNPDHGMFLYDEDSQYCYFNPNSLEPSEQFFLVGVVLGLAIYNSTILDVALPPFAFRKLLAAAPPPPLPTSQPRPAVTYTLDDLAEYRPRLARGLRQLLEYDGDDVEDVFGLDFALDADRYGAAERVPLCPGGEGRPVTNANRRAYVDAYVRYTLDTAVARQFEPFKRGFFTVCSSAAALALFRPEEIELLVRGASADDQPLDVAALRTGAVHEGWATPSSSSSTASPSAPARNPPPPPPPPPTITTTTPPHITTTDGTFDQQPHPPMQNETNNQAEEGNEEREDEGDEEEEETLRYFWSAFASAPPRDQRRLLAFITGSDRVPAMGAASLGIRVVCLGDECGRFPTARTCFNSIGLWRCRPRGRSSRGEGQGVGLRGGGGGGAPGPGDGGSSDRESERKRFEEVLWRAVRESEGFGLK